MSEWQKLGGAVPIKHYGAPVTVSAGVWGDFEAIRKQHRRIEEFYIESMNYSLSGEPLPFDRQLHWHKCHRWTARGVGDDPAIIHAEARWPAPQHWDDNIPQFFADWTDDLDEWPRTRLVEE